ncbi:MAG: amidohydrolase family protein [Pseudorhodoplanes sp.]|uniref:amidohydrolase family protein n=1 Tax=Pseudorhodoplanes sp. TaxID=1934341 RepID=UPI003D0AFE9C
MTVKEAEICAMPVMNTSTPSFKVPEGAVDAHCHIYGPTSKYPYGKALEYVPPAVDLADYVRMLDAIGCRHAVLVHAGVYGGDHSIVLDAMAAYPGRFRTIAVLNEDVTDETLEQLNAAGVCGFRSNLVSGKGIKLEGSRRLAARVKRFGWHVQVMFDAETFPDIETAFADFPTDVVIDHMGRPDPAKGVDAPAFQSIIRLLGTGRVWTKFSAPYRTSRDPKRYRDLAPFARALIAARPDRIVWGTDWPHPKVPADEMPDDGELINNVAIWAPDAAVQRRILVDNPKTLYGF